MTKKKSILTFVSVFLGAFLLAALGLRFMGSTHVTKQIPLTSEREVKVNLDAGMANIYLSRGGHSNVLDADVDLENTNDLEDCISYSLKSDVGYMDISTGGDTEGKHDRKGKSGFHWNVASSTWRLQFSDAVPMAYDIELGLGKADLDFTGLLIKDLTLSTGASSVSLRIDQPNKKVIENLNLEAGLSRFRAEGLCNANFNHMKFSGGVGTYTLDFGGSLDREVDVDIEVGLGTLTIIIPEDIGVKVYYEKNWLSHFDVSKTDFSEREDNVYYSQNFRETAGKLNMRVEAGLGSVKIRRE
jgi:hypothetical protein